MCGIAGILKFHGASADTRESLLMARMLAHRGPDGEGSYASGPIALAHRRLAIIDLSPAAAQPMPNEERTVWLVFNGEIYNYLELIPELRARGHIFRSRADSEVILHGYEEEGISCTGRFNGMWAFALWDAPRQRLLLSRDRLGEKPLYYAVDSAGLLFASEIKALLALRPDLAEPSLPQVAHFVATGQMETGSETFFRAIFQLPPAHSLIAHADGRVEVKRYWAAPLPEEIQPTSPREAASGLRALLEDSIRLRLRSDVPIGTCLSGGLDSSSVVALESRLLGGQSLHTFSSIFDEADYSERRFVEAVNGAFPTLPHRVTPPPAFLEVLPRIIWHQETPIHGPGVYPQWWVMDLARGRVKVLLDGQGADELLGGYFYYYPEHLADLLLESGSPRGLGMLLQALARIVRRTSLPGAARLFLEARRRVRGLPRPPGYQGGSFGMFLQPGLAPATRPAGEPAGPERGRFLAKALFDDLTRNSIPKLLHYEDRNSMAHGIEARVPFLDHRLVEFCLRLPAGRRIDAGVTKAPLRRGLADLLPPLVARRLDKKGFPEPVARWMKESSYSAVSEILLSERTRSRGLWRMDLVERALREHRTGQNRAVPLYRVLTTELWFRLFPEAEGMTLFGPSHAVAAAGGLPGARD